MILLVRTNLKAILRYVWTVKMEAMINFFMQSDPIYQKQDGGWHCIAYSQAEIASVKFIV